MSGIRFGRGQEYVFFRREEVKTQWDLPAAIRFLNRFRTDPHAMSAFRRQVSAGPAIGGLALTDEMVLAKYARLMVSGEVVVAYPAREQRIGHLSELRPVEEAPAPAPAPASQAAEEEDPPTFIQEHDGVAQAEALIVAARGGFPFCEECARRAAELAAPPAAPRQQSSPPPPAPLPPAQHRPPAAAEKAVKEPEPPPTYWVEIALIGEDDSPVPGEGYVITLPDGTRREGVLDGKGVARITGLTAEGVCQVSFPELDRDAWHFVNTVRN